MSQSNKKFEFYSNTIKDDLVLASSHVTSAREAYAQQDTAALKNELSAACINITKALYAVERHLEIKEMLENEKTTI